MADRFYGAEFGANKPSDVTEGAASTAALDVEVRITYDANGNSKVAALLALETIKNAIIADTWPPA